MKESLETEKKKNVDTERQLQELQEQHETSQYFSNLYKVFYYEQNTNLNNLIFQSQVRENKDEIEDARAEIENLKVINTKLEEDRRVLRDETNLKLSQKEQVFKEHREQFNQENDALICSLR